VISGRASLMSRPIFRMTPICSSLFRSEYFSSLCTPGLPFPPEKTALYVSRLALERTTMSLLVSLSVEGMGTCCSATSCGRAGGGRDCVPAIVSRSATVQCIMLNNLQAVFDRRWNFCDGGLLRERRAWESEEFFELDRVVGRRYSQSQPKLVFANTTVNGSKWCNGRKG